MIVWISNLRYVHGLGKVSKYSKAAIVAGVGRDKAFCVYEYK